MPDQRTIGYGLIGGGSFGRFAVEQYRSLAGVELCAVADRDPQTAQSAATQLGLEACESVEALLARNDIDLVHIATPPATHRPLVVQALEADKHVLCEKPLALTLQDGQAMIDLAHRRKRLLAVNLIMRFNPLAQALRTVIRTELLGKALHGFFENYAKDEPLPPDHWFWDRQASGGIFIEHGVHFFDLFDYWLQPTAESQAPAGVVEAAQQVQRPKARGPLIEQVQATVRYRADQAHDLGVLVNFYHSFTQPTRMDRQELRLLFERGTIRLFEWVPTRIEIDALCDGTTIEALQHVLPEPTVRRVAQYRGEDRQVTSRHKHYEVDGRFEITSGTGMDKTALYGHALRALLDDQIQAIRDDSHTRTITEANGYRCLQTAVEADRQARRGNA